MSGTAKKNVFISHVHEDDDLLPKIKDLVARADVEVSDWSINSAKPNEAINEDYIKNEILAPRINSASVLVVLITRDTADSWWVNWEIEYAAKLGKQIVGVFAFGATNADVPPALLQAGDAQVVGWRSESVAAAILDGKPIWEDPSGEAGQRLWDLERYRC